jgi:hypothetical protein
MGVLCLVTWCVAIAYLLMNGYESMVHPYLSHYPVCFITSVTLGIYNIGSLNSVVGVATRLRDGESGARISVRGSRPALGPTQLGVFTEDKAADL